MSFLVIYSFIIFFITFYLFVYFFAKRKYDPCVLQSFTFFLSLFLAQKQHYHQNIIVLKSQILLNQRFHSVLHRLFRCSTEKRTSKEDVSSYRRWMECTVFIQPTVITQIRRCLWCLLIISCFLLITKPCFAPPLETIVSLMYSDPTSYSQQPPPLCRLRLRRSLLRSQETMIKSLSVSSRGRSLLILCILGYSRLTSIARRWFYYSLVHCSCDFAFCMFLPFDFFVLIRMTFVVLLPLQELWASSSFLNASLQNSRLLLSFIEKKNHV